MIAPPSPLRQVLTVGAIFAAGAATVAVLTADPTPVSKKPSSEIAHLGWEAVLNGSDNDIRTLRAVYTFRDKEELDFSVYLPQNDKAFLDLLTWAREEVGAGARVTFVNRGFLGSRFGKAGVFYVGIARKMSGGGEDLLPPMAKRVLDLPANPRVLVEAIDRAMNYAVREDLARRAAIVTN